MLIVCPLAYEATFLRRRLSGVTIVTCGIGDTGVQQWSKRRPDTAPPGATVILAGVATGLTPAFATGDVAWASSVCGGESDTSWHPPLPAPANSPTAILAGSDVLLTDAGQRQRLHEQTGADIADQESAAFAALATARRWRWAIVRGISDDLHTPLPPDMATWVRPDGRTRVSRVLGSILKSPSIIGQVRQIRRDSAAALTAVAAEIRQLEPAFDPSLIDGG